MLSSAQAPSLGTVNPPRPQLATAIPDWRLPHSLRLLHCRCVEKDEAVKEAKREVRKDQHGSGPTNEKLAELKALCEETSAEATAVTGIKAKRGKK